MVQTMYTISDGQFRETHTDDRKILLLVRACDLNGIRRLDTMFLENGGTEDLYYKRIREKVNFFLMDCEEGWENCFCMSMGTNRAGGYNAALRFGEDGILAEVRDEALLEYFPSLEERSFAIGSLLHNQQTVRLPQISGPDMPERIHDLELWKQFDENCRGCGSCTTVCGTCSCFNTIDIYHTDILKKESHPDGERRRVWASCMAEGFTAMAGGHSVRKTKGEHMRFRTLHKIYDYRNRFEDGHMCVGCGRCVDRCPEDISFIEVINKLEKEAGALCQEVKDHEE